MLVWGVLHSGLNRGMIVSYDYHLTSQISVYAVAANPWPGRREPPLKVQKLVAGGPVASAFSASGPRELFCLVPIIPLMFALCLRPSTSLPGFALFRLWDCQKPISS